MLAKKFLALAPILSLTLVFSCKTREDIAREQMVDNISMQVRDGQKLNADFTVRLQSIEDRINSLSLFVFAKAKYLSRTRLTCGLIIHVVERATSGAFRTMVY